MLARYVRTLQLAELIAYVALGAWLHAARGWPVAGAALLGAALIPGWRLAPVCASFLLASAFSSPRSPEHRIGALAAIAMVLREWRAFCLFNLAYLPWERRFLRPDPVPEAFSGTPIVLAHGYFANRGYFRPLVRRLEANGVRGLFVPNLRSLFASIAVYEEELAQAIERISLGGRRKVVVIAHSMGGLGARAYLARHGASRVARLVTIASPHHGTALARFGVGENAGEMCPGSPFCRALEQREDASGPGIPVTSIYSTHDNMVAPQESSRLAWARNIVLPGYGHIDIGGCDAVAAILLEELREAGVAGPR